MKKLLTAIIALNFITGCATSLVSREHAKVVPSGRLYQPELVYQDELEKAEVVIIRDSGFVGSACLHRLWVDNVKVAALDAGEAITLGLTAGPHFVRIEVGVGMCANMQVSESMDLRAGDKRLYRVMSDSNFKLSLVRME